MHYDALKPELEKFKQDIDDSITQVTTDFKFLPTGPLQRDNAEMIFNLYAFYPLKLYLPGFQPIVNTIHWLWDNYVQEGGVLIDQPHNAYGTYLSILIAQAFRYIEEFENVPQIIEFMIKNVTNRSGWAEGISPLSNKGAVGDSPNGFVAAEWINLILDLFCEQAIDGPPVFLKGIPIDWLTNGIKATNLLIHHHGHVDIDAKLDGDKLRVNWKIDIKESGIKPQLYLPYAAKKIPGGAEQLSTKVLVLNSLKGSIDITLDIT